MEWECLLCEELDRNRKAFLRPKEGIRERCLQRAGRGLRSSPAKVIGFAAIAVAALGGVVHLRMEPSISGPVTLLGSRFLGPWRIRAKIHMETCGLLQRSCAHLEGREKIRCGLARLCALHTSKDECDAEDGAACKHGWGDGSGSNGMERSMNASVSSIMRVAARDREKNIQDEEEDDGAVAKVLKELGSSLTKRHSRYSYNKKRYGKVRQYSPRSRRYRTHRYNRSVRHRANRRAKYRRWKAHFYQPRNRDGVSFDFRTGKYSNGEYPLGVYNNTYPRPRASRIKGVFQNGRRLSRGFKYRRKPGKWEYIKYNHTYAHCHRPQCRRPPYDGDERFHRPHHGAPYPRMGKGVIYNGQYKRRGYYPRAPFYDGQTPSSIPDFSNQDAVIEYERDGQGPQPKPFGKTNIMWQPNAQDCGGGGEDYDYGCWEPNDDDFELPVFDDDDPVNVKIQWCEWGEEMVPCTPGFGGAYYKPGMRGNDRGIWPKVEERHNDVMQGPVEVHAGVRSDPYFYEEGRGRGREDDTDQDVDEEDDESAEAE